MNSAASRIAAVPALSKEEAAARAYRELRAKIDAARAELAKLEASAQPLIETLVIGCKVRTVVVDGTPITFRLDPSRPSRGVRWLEVPLRVAK